MRYHSYASSSRGKTDPEEVFAVNVTDEECDLNGCTSNRCDHTVFMWSGNEYSKNHTWIAADGDYVINLEKAR